MASHHHADERLPDEAGLPRLVDVVGELVEEPRQHRVDVAARFLGVEEASVVDEAARQLVEFLEELELVRSDTDELDEDRQAAHLDERPLCLLRVLRLAVGDDDREGRVVSGDRRLPVAAEEAPLAACEAGLLLHPVEGGGVDGAVVARTLARDEPACVAEGDLAEVLDVVAEERHRHAAVVVEDQSGGENEVGGFLDGAAGIQVIGGAAVVEAGHHRGLVQVGVEALLQDQLGAGAHVCGDLGGGLIGLVDLLGEGLLFRVQSHGVLTFSSGVMVRGRMTVYGTGGQCM